MSFHIKQNRIGLLLRPVYISSSIIQKGPTPKFNQVEFSLDVEYSQPSSASGICVAFSLQSDIIAIFSRKLDECGLRSLAKNTVKFAEHEIIFIRLLSMVSEIAQYKWYRKRAHQSISSTLFSRT